MVWLQCPCPCPAPPTLWHLHQNIILMQSTHNNPLLGGLFFPSLLPWGPALLPHTLYFCSAPKVISLNFRSSCELILSEDRRGLLITHCHGCWHSPTPQLLPTASFYPIELSNGLLQLPSKPPSPSLGLLPVLHTSSTHL